MMEQLTGYSNLLSQATTRHLTLWCIWRGGVKVLGAQEIVQKQACSFLTLVPKSPLPLPPPLHHNSMLQECN